MAISKKNKHFPKKSTKNTLGTKKNKVVEKKYKKALCFLKTESGTHAMYLVRCIWSWTGAGLLQTRSGTICQRDKAPDNSILRPFALVSKSLQGAGKRYSNIEREALGIP